MVAPGRAQRPQMPDERRASADPPCKQVAVPTAIFRQRGHAQVDAVLERTLGKGAEQRVVDHDERSPLLPRADLVGQADHQREIDDRGRGIGRRLRDDERKRPERERAIGGGADIGFIGPVDIGRGVRPKARHHAVVQHVDTAVDWPAVKDAVTGFHEPQSDRCMRGHAAAKDGGRLSPVDRRQPLFRGSRGWGGRDASRYGRPRRRVVPRRRKKAWCTSFACCADG